MPVLSLVRLTIATVLLLSFAGTAAAQNLAGCVQSGVSPEQWMKSFGEANQETWSHVEKPTPLMEEILSRVTDAADELSRERAAPCEAAARNHASRVLNDQQYQKAFDVLQEIVTNSITNILKLGNVGVVDFLKDKLKDATQDAIKELLEKFVKDQLAGTRPEVYMTSINQNGCDLRMVVIADLKGSKYDVYLYSDCKCQQMPIFGGDRTIRLRTYGVHFSGTLLTRIDPKTLKATTGVSRARADRPVPADCRCENPNQVCQLIDDQHNVWKETVTFFRVEFARNKFRVVLFQVSGAGIL